MHRKSLPRTSLSISKDCPIPPLIAYRVDNVGYYLSVDLLCCGGFSVDLIEFVGGGVVGGSRGVWFNDCCVGVGWTDCPCSRLFIVVPTVVGLARKE